MDPKLIKYDLLNSVKPVNKRPKKYTLVKEANITGGFLELKKSDNVGHVICYSNKNNTKTKDYEGM